MPALSRANSRVTSSIPFRSLRVLPTAPVIQIMNPRFFHYYPTDLILCRVGGWDEGIYLGNIMNISIHSTTYVARPLFGTISPGGLERWYRVHYVAAEPLLSVCEHRSDDVSDGVAHNTLVFPPSDLPYVCVYVNHSSCFHIYDFKWIIALRVGGTPECLCACVSTTKKWLY